MTFKSIVQTLVLLCCAPAFAQTPVLIAHTTGTGTTPAINTTGANTILMCANAQTYVPGFTDTYNNKFVKIWESDQQGYSYSALWAAFGAKVGVNHTFNIGGGQMAIAAFSNLASGPDKTSNGANATTMSLSAITPSNANELLFSCYMANYLQTASLTVSGGMTQLDTNAVTGNVTDNVADAYQIQTTPTAQGATWTSNATNGNSGYLVSLYSRANPAPLTITTTSLPSGNQTIPYGPVTLTASGGALPYTWALTTGTLPTGLTFDAPSATISGTATAPSSPSLTFTVTDSLGATATKTMTLVMNGPPPIQITAHQPNYGWVLHTGSQRVMTANLLYDNGPSLINWSVDQGAQISCDAGQTWSTTSIANCPGAVTLQVTAANGTCTRNGTVGNYSIGVTPSTSVVHLTAQAVDDTTKSSTILINVCTGNPKVQVEPSYQQAFFNESVQVQSWVAGYVNDAVSWTCQNESNSTDCTAMLADTNKRDAVFTAGTTTGRYKLTACSNASGGTVCNYAHVYVGGPKPAACGNVTPTNTKPMACFADPAFTVSKTVCPGGTCTVARIQDAGILNATGLLLRVFNTDTTGTNPTVYAERAQFSASGTRDTPNYVCGVVDNTACHAPILEGNRATENSTDDCYGTCPPGAFMWFRPHVTGGYNLGSAGPDYTALTGFDIQETIDGGVYSATTTYAKGTVVTLKGFPYVSLQAGNLGNDPTAYNSPWWTDTTYGLWSGAGQHTYLGGLSFTNITMGMIFNNNTLYSGQKYTQFWTLRGSAFQNFSTPSCGEHAVYAEMMNSVIENNFFGQANYNSCGDFIKMRGAAIFRYNQFIGHSGFASVDLPAMTDASPYVALDINFGTPGDTVCGDSRQCADGADAATIADLTDNAEFLAHDYMYGNIISNQDDGPNSHMIGYGSNEVDECQGLYGAVCSNMEDHLGSFMAWNNTFDQPYSVAWSNNLYQTGYMMHGTQYAQPYFVYENNVMYSDCANGFPMQVDGGVYFTGKMRTNAFCNGTVSITTPITGGTTTGWGGLVANMTAWSTAQPMDKHINGLAAANFININTGFPYNRASFVPVAGSPLLNAGSPVTETAMQLLPVRYQPDVVAGGMKPRTNPLTIGAVETGSYPTVVSRNITPNPVTSIVNGPYVYPIFYTMWSNGAKEYDYSRYYNPTSTNSASAAFASSGGVPLITFGVAGTGTLTMDFTGGTASVPFSVGGATPPPSAPTFSVPSGTYVSTLNVTITDATPGASIYYTTNGTTPTAASTLYSSPVVITGTTNLQAIAVASGVSSTVSSAQYTITNPNGPYIQGNVLSQGNTSN